MIEKNAMSGSGAVGRSPAALGRRTEAETLATGYGPGARTADVGARGEPVTRGRPNPWDVRAIASARGATARTK
jgi:hypothetical protein